MEKRQVVYNTQRWHLALGCRRARIAPWFYQAQPHSRRL